MFSFLLVPLLVVGVDDALLAAVIGGAITLISTIINVGGSAVASDRAATRAEDFSRKATLDEREYNLPSNQVDRLVSAGATKGGALNSILGASPYISPPMQSVSPVNNASNITSALSSLVGSIGGFGETMRDIEEVRSSREMLPFNQARVQAEINHLAVQDDWTEAQKNNAERTLQMCEGRYVAEVRQMQQDFERGMVEIDNLVKQGKLTEAQIGLTEAQTGLTEAQTELTEAQTGNELLLQVINGLDAEFCKKYAINPRLSPWSMLAMAVTSPNAGDIVSDVSNTVGDVYDTVKNGSKKQYDKYNSDLEFRINQAVSPIRNTFHSITGVGTERHYWERNNYHYFSVGGKY